MKGNPGNAGAYILLAKNDDTYDGIGITIGGKENTLSSIDGFNSTQVPTTLLCDKILTLLIHSLPRLWTLSPHVTVAQFRSSGSEQLLGSRVTRPVFTRSRLRLEEALR